MPALCRDCTTLFDAEGSRCPRCHSPRVLRHAELTTLTIAHIDCDAFFAAVEKRDRPELANKPVIVGGGKRGVVSTCCYIARIDGVRSAMPMFKALAACPDAVVIKPDHEKYSRVGRQIREMMLALTPLVEPVSIDEAYLDLTGTERVHRAPPAVVLADFAARVEKEIGISVSVGLSCNRFLAKIASDLDKPRGFAVIGKAEAAAFLAPRPVGIIPGVGKVMQERLAKDHIRTIGDLQTLDIAELARRYGEEGLRLARLARGEDARSISPRREVKSVSAETTFLTDTSDAEVLAASLLSLCEKVGRRLRQSDLGGRVVTLKLKTSDFRPLTRARALSEPTQLATRIFDVARDLLMPEAKGQRYRLIGVGVSDLGPGREADHGDLVDTATPRQARMERALDTLRGRFGTASVQRGTVFSARRKDDEAD
jgi:DNA polymerase-4